MKLGVSGDEGSFSEQAGLLYAKKMGLDVSLVYLTDAKGVLQALELKKIDRGIFPVVNSQGGLVRMAFEAMGDYLFKYIDEIGLDIRQCLMVKPGMTKKNIRKIVSHQQALKQCQTYIAIHFKNCEVIEWQDTAKAARDLSENLLEESVAVIASEESAKRYGLEILEKNIQDSSLNITIFIIVVNTLGMVK